MLQAVSSRFLTAKALLIPASLWEVCGGQSDTGTGFYPSIYQKDERAKSREPSVLSDIGEH
jgi:hypothetical protein